MKSDRLDEAGRPLWIGSATYAHVEPTVSEGAWINRWETQIGTVGGGYRTASGCWGGPHVHFQMYSEHNYACYNKDWHPSQWMGVHEFVGFVGGSYASGPRQACP